MKLLMPQELRKYAFNHAIRGYSTAEVDEYIEFLCGKYEEVYREHDELERKLIAALRALDQLKNRESQITELDSQAKRASARMLAEAEAQKKRIVADAEEYADRIIADADAHVARQQQVLARMRRTVLAFRDELYSRYNTQIDQIEALTALAQSDDPLPPEEEGTAVPIGAIEPAGEIGEISPAEETEESAADDEPEMPDEAADDDEVLAAEISETDEALMFYDESEETAEAAGEDEDGDEAAAPAAAEEQFYALFDSSAEAVDDDGDADAEEDEDGADGDDDEPAGEPDDGDLMKFLEEFTVSYDGDKSDADDSDDEEEDDEAEEAGEAGESDEEEAEEEAKADDGDDALLRELRQTFGINFETFTAEAEKDSDYDFLPEEDSGESVELTPRRRAKKKEEKDNRR